jgi:hypothetical protein
MRWLFSAVARRVRAALLADAAGWVETQFHVRSANQAAALLTEADRHAAAGRARVAEALRRRAAELSGDRPLAGVLAAVEHLAAGGTAGPPVPALPPRRPGRKRG